MRMRHVQKPVKLLEAVSMISQFHIGLTPLIALIQISVEPAAVTQNCVASFTNNTVDCLCFFDSDVK